MHAATERISIMRQSSSRNHRSKAGFRLKHVLQICILLAICTWLIYQVKHSHDKKRSYEERMAKISPKLMEKQTHFSDFGRKGLPVVANNDPAKDKDEEEGAVEDSEREQVGDEEVKPDADDGINEPDQDGGDSENEQEEEFTSEDEKDGQVEEDAFFDDDEHEDGAREAREENYRGDDASSAVAHDGHEAKGLYGGQEIEDSGNAGTATNGTYDEKITSLGSVTSTSNVSTVSQSSSDTKGAGMEIMETENGWASDRIELKPNATMSTLPENNLEITATPTVNVSNSLPQYQNSPKLDERSDLTPVQDQQNLFSEISREVPVENDKKFNTSGGHGIEIYPKNSTTIDN